MTIRVFRQVDALAHDRVLHGIELIGGLIPNEVVRTLIARPTAAAELIHYTLPCPDEHRPFRPARSRHHRILHVTAGVVTIGSGSGEPITLRSGDRAYMPADREHRLSNPANEPGGVVILIIRPAL
ncbi:cupin domain-containing protein [Streptomyces sp. NPDC091280]|uniref:cupin domain-containing protein n=1 Tax=Streptomyces sp. NPDC091280 TaxID=3365984 RepID=UPI00382F6238